MVRQGLAISIFCFLDFLFIVAGVLLAGYFRFQGGMGPLFKMDYLPLKIVVILFVVQMSFYYLDAYDFKNFREKKRLFIQELKSIVATTILLTCIYYLFPLLSMDSGMLAISLGLIWIFTFLWRLFFVWASRRKPLRERILIIGTGDLARRIRREILEGQGNFEIIGFVDESGSDEAKRKSGGKD